MTPTEIANDQVVTHADLQLFFASLQALLLKWVLGVGLAAVVSATLLFARLEGRIAAVETRNASDSSLLSAMDASGSQPVRSLAHDLEQTRADMAELQSSLTKLEALVTELRIQLAKRGP